MTPEMLIAHLESKYREHLEMYPNPDRMLIRILANQVVKLEDQNEYLKKRLEKEVTYE
jgi:hypothetical protein